MYFYYGLSSEPKAGIWKTDGTVVGTGRISDIVDDPDYTIQKVGSKILYSDGFMLWVTDGTPQNVNFIFCLR
ncbi:MAG: hypothetical protein WDO15_25690 [Bacteroidota bacterium]